MRRKKGVERAGVTAIYRSTRIKYEEAGRDRAEQSIAEHSRQGRAGQGMVEEDRD